MNCILPTSKLYKDLSNLTDNSQPLIAYLNDVISMYQNEGFITQNRFKPDTGKIMYTVPKVIMEDSISAWLKSIGKGFKKDAKTKEKFEFVLSENSHDSFVKIKEFDKVIIVEFLAPDPDLVIPEELDLNDLIDEIELTEEQISEEALRTQEENEDKEFSVVKPETIAGVKPGVEELFDSNPELASIGTQEQYSQYLDSIFPDSQVKDIVYHGTNNIFESFSKSKLGESTTSPSAYEGFFFTNNIELANYYSGKNDLELTQNMYTPTSKYKDTITDEDIDFSGKLNYIETNDINTLSYKYDTNSKLFKVRDVLLGIVMVLIPGFIIPDVN